MKEGTKLLFRVFYGALAVILIASIWVHYATHPEVHFFWEGFPLFSAFYGFIGCVVIILGSKAIGHSFLQKRENYYERQDRKGSKGR
jgi:hypothetical protein